MIMNSVLQSKQLYILKRKLKISTVGHANVPSVTFHYSKINCINVSLVKFTAKVF